MNENRIILPGQKMPQGNELARLQNHNALLFRDLQMLQKSHDGLFTLLLTLLRREKKRTVTLTQREANLEFRLNEWFIHQNKGKKGTLVIRAEHITDNREKADDGLDKAGSGGNAIKSGTESSGKGS